MTNAPKLMAETPKVAGAAGEPGSGVLAEALRMVRLSGAVYLRGEFRAPWGFESPSGPELARALRHDSEQLVVFHAIVEGSVEVRLASGESVRAEAGEFVMLPFGDTHWMLSPGSSARVPAMELLPPPPWTSMLISQAGEPEGAPTRLLCSYLDCGDVLFNPLLRALPPLLKIHPQAGAGAEWLKTSIAYAAELSPDQVARDAIGSRLPELLLVEALRQHFSQLPAQQTRWLSALADPLIGDALVRIHGDPARAWTVGLLADELAVSRSVLAERFRQRLGQSPMRYVALWRGQLASHLLQTSDLPIGTVALRVGYESEAAFSRAFKRMVGTAPGAWRSGNRRGPALG